ncbi:MAG: hypothetical protein QOD39_3896 [Mycobacterium sp.]|jgi:hypothetical protein|nr:hypothetical protein [Mycobacterium sp.]
MPSHNTTVRSLLLGAAATGAILAGAPIAIADPPPPTDTTEPTPPPVAPVINNIVDGVSGLQPSPPPAAGPTNGVGTGGTVLINGVPTYIPPEGLTIPNGSVVGPPVAWLESVKQTGCAPGCVPSEWADAYKQYVSGAVSAAAGAASPSQPTEPPPAPTPYISEGPSRGRQGVDTEDR